MPRYSLVLRVDPLDGLVEDCGIILYSHETSTPERRWDRVASFLEEILA